MVVCHHVVRVRSMRWAALNSPADRPAAALYVPWHSERYVRRWQVSPERRRSLLCVFRPKSLEDLLESRGDPRRESMFPEFQLVAPLGTEPTE